MSTAQPSTFELEQKFFQGARTVVVEVEILEETYQDALRVFSANSWSPEEGFRIALTTGLGKMKTEQLMDSVESSNGPSSITNRLMQLESLYAVMKHRVFHLMRDNQALEFQNSASRNVLSGHQVVIERLREENGQLRARMAELSTGALPGLIGPPPAPTPLPPTGLPHGVRHALRRLLHLRRGHEGE